MSWGEKFGWTLLSIGLAALLLAAASFDRRSWPHFEGDETTYLMQAESLAYDFDIRYSSRDHLRFVEHWGKPPEGLILQSLDAGQTLVYGKPILYSLAIAPFVRLAPVRGAAIANGLMLAIAALATALSLRTWIAGAAPWWTLAFVFASVTFAYVPWAHADLFLASAVATAYALALRRRPMADEAAETFAPRLVRWDLVVAAFLLGAVAACRPVPYVLLALPLFVVALPRRRNAVAVVVAVLLALVATAALDWSTRDYWTSYGGERLSFDSATGFPDQTLSVEAWKRWVAERGPADWTAAGRRLPYRLNPRTWGFDFWYFLVGRDVGLLPYYPAVLLGLIAFRRDGVRWSLLLAFLGVAAGFILLRPFNFYGGGGALANRYILPAIPALWFLAAWPRSSGWTLLPFSLGALLLANVWTAPWAPRLRDDGSFRWVTAAAERWLPYETTQSHLKPSGGEDFVHRGLWLKPLDVHLAQDTQAGAERLRLRGATETDFLVGSQAPISSICLSTGVEAGLRIEGISGLLPRVRRDTMTTRVATAEPTARHAMWWSEDDWNLYRLRVTAAPGAAATPFHLVPGCIEIRRP